MTKQSHSKPYKERLLIELSFVSFAVVNWIGIFVRPLYNEIRLESLNYCKANLGMELFCWYIMPSHVHLIFRTTDKKPAVVLGRFKEYTSKQLVKAIRENIPESRKEWMLWMFARAGSKSSNVSKNQFWQHDNRPIALWSAEVIEQKADYLHNNPVVAGFVNELYEWRYSSTIDYSGGKGLIEIAFLG